MPEEGVLTFHFNRAIFVLRTMTSTHRTVIKRWSTALIANKNVLYRLSRTQPRVHLVVPIRCHSRRT